MCFQITFGDLNITKHTSLCCRFLCFYVNFVCGYCCLDFIACFGLGFPTSFASE